MDNQLELKSSSSASDEGHSPLFTPLAARMRPRNIDEVCGQKHLMAPGARLRRMIDSGAISSIIMWGPPGCGKTTIARVIARTCKASFHQLSAVLAGVKEIREIAARAGVLKMNGKKTVLFLDEIHRFSKAQQDVLLPFVEDGTLILVGATTEDPVFALTRALMSRSSIFRLEPLSEDELRILAERSLNDSERGVTAGYGRTIKATEEALDFLVSRANGDARFLLNALELAAADLEPSDMEDNDSSEVVLNLSAAESCIQEKKLRYDRSGEEHYDVISAFIKSIRGSDPDATIYWLALMLKSGEDPRFVARRMVILASEDVGNADPNALNIAVSAFRATEIIGMPEVRINLAQTALYLACAPKSNAAYKALLEAEICIEQKPVQPVPSHLRSPSRKDKEAPGYLYPHDYPGGWIKQNYLQNKEVFYMPKEIGFEKRLAVFVKSLREKND